MFVFFLRIPLNAFINESVSQIGLVYDIENIHEFALIEIATIFGVK